MKVAVNRNAELPVEVIQRRRYQLQRRKNWSRLVRNLMATIIAVFVLFGVFWGIGLVRGQSMAPSFHDGDLVLFWRLAGQYNQGDVVVFKRNAKEDELIKRIVATPDDTVDVNSEGRLMANGKVLEDIYTKPGVEYPLTLMGDEYFVLGDKQNAAIDSRNFGPVKKTDIDGKVILIFRTQKH